MSHIVKVKSVEVKDKSALLDAVKMVDGAKLLQDGNNVSHKLYNSHKTGVGVSLKGWNYPVVFDVEAGEVSYDNYGGSWGKQDELDHLIQEYTLQATENAAIREDPTCHIHREALEDGEQRLILEYA